jgi:hypothetical protein
MRVEDSYVPSLISNSTYERAHDLRALYVHDDRIGPYMRADLVLADGGRYLNLNLRLHREAGRPEQTEEWTLTHILIPMHAKIRLSFSSLRALAFLIVSRLHAVFDVLRARKRLTPTQDRTVCFQTWISLSHRYLEELLVPNRMADPVRVEELCNRIPLPRYVGVVRLTSAAGIDPIDVLVDTTSTKTNLHLLAVMPLRGRKSHTRFAAETLSSELNCPFIHL